MPKLRHLIAVAALAVTALTAGLASSASAVTPRPAPHYRVSAVTTNFACIAVKAAGAHIGGYAAIDGPFTDESTATSDCTSRQSSTPTVNGVPVRWTVNTVS